MAKQEKRTLLFISKYPQIIQEFLEAMGEKDIEIDTAMNGLEAAAKLRKNGYQVVVTGLSLEGFNGEQIITYLNKNLPNTVCIIYTTTISPAQLHFFINERNVFRVFLRPVDFHKEFSEALEEAFEYHDVQVKNTEELVSGLTEQKRQQQEIRMIDQRMGMQDHAKERMNRYMRRLMELTLEEYSVRRGEEQKQQMARMEQTIVGYCCERGEQEAESLAKAEALIGDVREVSGVIRR